MHIPNILFSEFFHVSPEDIKSYGAIDVSVVADLPLYIDPFLLFSSGKMEYQELHNSIIRYLDFLRQKSSPQRAEKGLISSLYTFPEIKQTWLGVSATGNQGQGLGPTFANSLYRNLGRIFTDNDITLSRHLEKLCLFGERVGKDKISDFTTNLIKAYLLEYTQRFTMKHVPVEMRGKYAIDKVVFDYNLEYWLPQTYTLPKLNSSKEGYVILTPRDLLRRSNTWINSNDLNSEILELPEAIPDDQIRAAVNNYLRKALPKEPTKFQIKKATSEAIKIYPVIIDYFIRRKEDNENAAQRLSAAEVKYAEVVFLGQFKRLSSALAERTNFYKNNDNSLSEARVRIQDIRSVVEGGEHKQLYVNGHQLVYEDDLNVLQNFLWNTDADNPQSEFSVVVDFKLGSNDQLSRYFASNASGKGKIFKIAVVFCYSTYEANKVAAVAKKVNFPDTNLEIIIVPELSQEDLDTMETFVGPKEVEHVDKDMPRPFFALTIGISDYPEANKLPKEVLNDAKDIAQLLQDPDICGYPQENVQVLLDKEATKQNILAKIEWLSQSVPSDGCVVIFFSGHGGRILNGVEAGTYLIPFDYKKSKISSTGISSAEFTDALRSIKCRRLVILLDACHSGGTGELKALEGLPFEFKTGFESKAIDELAEGTGRVIIASSRDTEVSYISTNEPNSLFTSVLLEGLRGAARSQGESIVRIFSLFQYVSENVSKQAVSKGLSQHPIFKATNVENDFAVALIGSKSIAPSITGEEDTLTSTHSTIDTAKPGQQANSTVRITPLKNFLIQKFNMEDLEELCLEFSEALKDIDITVPLSVDHLGGVTIRGTAINLIKFAEKYDQLNLLFQTVRGLRPGQTF